MSLQVGMSCYSTAAQAGRAACSQYQPLSTINGNILKTVSCSSADTSTGALHLDIVTTDTSTSSVSSVQVSQQITFSDCVNQDYIDAAAIIFPALLAVYVVWICGWKMLSFVGWSRGENA